MRERIGVGLEREARGSREVDGSEWIRGTFMYEGSAWLAVNLVVN